MRYIATIDSRQITIQNVDPASGSAMVEGRAVRFDMQQVRPGLFSLIFDNRVYTVQVATGKAAAEISIGPHHHRVVVEDERALLLRKLAKTEEESGPLEVNSPMPGLVVRLSVAAGERVKKGQRLVTIEAMKMDNEIKSPVDGVVEQIFVSERDVVEKDAKLLRLSKTPSGKSNNGLLKKLNIES